MTTGGAQICAGVVGHARLRPRKHALAYSVFALLIDVDAIDQVAARSRWFSRNRFNLIALHDRDYGAGDGTALAEHARRRLHVAGLAEAGHSIRLLTYPRLLGYAFNPLSVYFCSDPDGELRALIYEVNNTFGERVSYVVAAGTATNGVHAHGCAKAMAVSPFTDNNGRYSFRVRPLDADGDVLVAVLLRDAAGPLIRTHFRARPEPLSDRGLLRVVANYPLMTLKVVAAIHFEAAKLWFKGVPLVRRLPLAKRQPAAQAWPEKA